MPKGKGGGVMARLGFVTGSTRGEADRLLAGVVARLQARGWPLAGVVQHNTGCEGACDMDLAILGRAEVVRISQSLGPGSSGCRLDPQGLEAAVGLVGPMLAGARLLVVNKFGKAEAEGRGFRPLIGEALAAGIPVLVAVSALNRPAFEDFAGDLAEPLPAREAALLAWCDAAAALAPG